MTTNQNDSDHFLKSEERSDKTSPIKELSLEPALINGGRVVNYLRHLNVYLAIMTITIIHR